MQILRSLLNSGVFMVLLVVAVSVYLAYSEQIQSSLEELEVTSSNMLSRASSSESESSTSAVAETVQPSSSVESKVEIVSPVVEASASPVPVVQPAPVENREEAVVNASQASQPVLTIAEPMPMPAMPAMTEAMPMPAMPEMPVMPAMTEPMPMPAMPEVAQSMPVMAMPAQVPQTAYMNGVAGGDVLAALDDARRAFQSGNLDEAEARYRAILSVSDSPDAFGELGNIFFTRRQFSDANDAYLKAAEGLIAQNRLLQAQYVIGVLMNSQPEYAQKAMQAFNAKLQAKR